MAGVPSSSQGGMGLQDLNTAMPGLILEPFIKTEPAEVVNQQDDGLDPDLQALLHTLSQDVECGPAPTHSNASLTGLGHAGIQFPLDSGIVMPGTSLTNGSIGDNGTWSPLSRPGPSLLPEAVSNVNSHQALDDLMSLVQQQSDVYHASQNHFGASFHSHTLGINSPAQGTCYNPAGISNQVTRPSGHMTVPLGHVTMSSNQVAGSSNQSVGASSHNIGTSSHVTAPPRTARLTEAHTLVPGERHDARPAASNAFHVDTDQLVSVPLNEQDQELQSLGLRVYNRDDIEQGIMAQVDQAIAHEEEERLKKILEKQLKAVVDDIGNVKKDLASATKVIKLLGPQNSHRDSATKKKLDAVLRQRENKIKQLKKLKAKQKLLTKKLTGSAEGLDSEEEQLLAGDGEVALEQALGLGSAAKETETERMIRQGEMTPFGTVMASASKPDATGPRLSTSGEMTSFEKYLMDQQQKVSSHKKQSTGKNKAGNTKGQNEKRTKKSDQTKQTVKDKKAKLKKSQSAPALSTLGDKPDPTSSRASRPNLFDAKDKRTYRASERDFSNYSSGRPRFARLKHNFSGDGRLSDNEDMLDDETYCKDGDYIPPAEDLVGDDSDYLSDQATPPPTTTKGRTKRGRKRAAVNRGGASSEEEEGTPRKKRDTADTGDVSLKRARDDGDYDRFKERIRRWKKERLVRKQQKAEANESDSSDSEFEEVDVNDGFKLPSKVWNKLYPYQQTCVRWLYELHSQQAGGIVGDEMGLGKTIQLISFLVGLKVSRLKDKGATTRYIGLGPTLIVCPATVMHQWVREFHKWWAPFRVAILHGSGSYTSSAAQLVDDVASSHGVLITSFSGLTLQQDVLLEYDWHYVILDEGHKIRNPDAQVTVAAKRFRTCHRLILSGSPVQNNLKELWSLFDFVFPGKLGTLPDFMAHFSVPIVQGGYSTASQVQVQTAYKCACVLRDTINPYLLRRMKSDVRHNLTLPDKNEQVLFCRMTDDQREVYKEYLQSKECGMILKGDFMVFPGLITLRKICNHPDLSTGGPQLFDLGFRDYAEGEKEYGYWKRAGKMQVIDQLLRLWRKQDHRVLLFSQSKQMLDILETYVQSQGYKYLRMDGGTGIASRQPLINKFNQDSSYFIFLLTTRVGGLGVNLTGANRIIIYDPDWNPSTDMQARERAWRIGQKRQVTIYRLLTAGTIEEKIYHRQIFKQFLTNRVLKDPKQRRFFKANDLFELFSLNDIDSGGSTETSAIFAGTGSDVRVKKPSLPKTKRNGELRSNSESRTATRPNRFDVLREKQAKDGVEEEEEEDITMDEQGSVPKDGEQSGSPAEAGPTEVSPLRDTDPEPTALTDNPTPDEDPKLAKMKELAKKLSQQLGKGKSDAERTDTDRATSQHKLKKSKHKKAEKETSSKRHKKKKKKKDAVFEGERIKNLSRAETFVRNDGKEEEEKSKNTDQDNFVLAKLLNKSGVHSALQHDKIMMSSDPDYALVEGEAERVARDAAQALRRSRQQCNSARSGIPTWTGQNGAVQAPAAKPRFGQKKNSKLLPAKAASATATATATAPTPGIKREPSSEKKAVAPPASDGQHFDGTLAGNVKTSKTEGSGPSVMTSDQLLSRMKSRNSLSLGESGSGSSEGMAGNVDLITDIRNYVAFTAHVSGQASTQEILDHFKPSVPQETAATFRAMLRQVCDFTKTRGVGMWVLKPDFR